MITLCALALGIVAYSLMIYLFKRGSQTPEAPPVDPQAGACRLCRGLGWVYDFETWQPEPCVCKSETNVLEQEVSEANGQDYHH